MSWQLPARQAWLSDELAESVMAAVVPLEAATSAVLDDSGPPSMQINSASSIDMAAFEGAAAQSSCDVSTPAEAIPGAKAKRAAMMNKRATMGGRIQPPRGQSTTHSIDFVFAANCSNRTTSAQHPPVAVLRQMVSTPAPKQVKRQLPQSRRLRAQSNRWPRWSTAPPVEPGAGSRILR